MYLLSFSYVRPLPILSANIHRIIQTPRFHFLFLFFVLRAAACVNKATLWMYRTANILLSVSPKFAILKSSGILFQFITKTWFSLVNKLVRYPNTDYAT